MNTLSSLLNWIGNTIGANPNTLTTASKKIIGAINEVDSKVDTVDNKVDASLTRTPITVTATSTTTGTISTIVCYRCGNIVWLSVTGYNSSSVAAGANVCQATLSSALPRPYAFTTTGTYFGNHAITGSINAERTLIIRNANATPVTISGGGSGSTTMTFTYITQD